MPNLRDTRLRIKSIQQTLKITSAMKLISTAKLSRARVQLSQTVPYFDRVRETIGEIFLHSEVFRDRYFEPRKRATGKPRRAFLVMTSDRGLAGGFNHNVISLAESSMTEQKSDYLIVLGSVGSRYFMHTDRPILENVQLLGNIPTVYDAREVSDFVLEQYEQGTIDEFYAVYTHMHSSVKLVPTILRVLPLDRITFGMNGEGDSSLQFLPSPDSVMEAIVPKYLSGVIYGAMVESFASEQSARMTAMDSATKNAREMLTALNQSFNRIRQSAITREVTEIVAGAAALE